MLTSHIPYANFSAVCDAVKAMLAGTAGVVYANDGSTPFLEQGHPWSYPAKLPQSLDIFSIDHYSCHYKGQPCETDPLAEVAELRKLLTTLVIPRLWPHQRLMVIPGLFGDFNTTRSGPLARQEEMLLGKLEAYHRWVAVDKLVVGMLPWYVARLSSVRVGF